MQRMLKRAAMKSGERSMTSFDDSGRQRTMDILMVMMTMVGLEVRMVR
jgi:hypothetical protein